MALSILQRQKRTSRTRNTIRIIYFFTDNKSKSMKKSSHYLFFKSSCNYLESSVHFHFYKSLRWLTYMHQQPESKPVASKSANSLMFPWFRIYPSRYQIPVSIVYWTVSILVSPFTRKFARRAQLCFSLGCRAAESCYILTSKKFRALHHTTSALHVL